jgi:hypothetical protein
MAEPGVVLGVGVVVVVVARVVACFAWNAPHPLKNAVKSRENAKQRWDDLVKGVSPECCKWGKSNKFRSGRMYDFRCKRRATTEW